MLDYENGDADGYLFEQLLQKWNANEYNVRNAWRHQGEERGRVGRDISPTERKDGIYGEGNASQKQIYPSVDELYKILYDSHKKWGISHHEHTPINLQVSKLTHLRCIVLKYSFVTTKSSL